MFRGLVDPAPEVVDLLEVRHLSADEPEHHQLALRNEPQRCEASGARAIVFEQKSVVWQLGEQPLGDRVVAAFTVPHAALVATAEVNAESHSGEARNDRRLRLERARKIRHWILAPRT